MNTNVLQISIRCNKMRRWRKGISLEFAFFFIKNLFLLQFPTKKGRE